MFSFAAVQPVNHGSGLVGTFASLAPWGPACGATPTFEAAVPTVLVALLFGASLAVQAAVNPKGVSDAPVVAPAPDLQHIASSHRLSPRETEVFELLAKGRSAPFIRDELCISLNTVISHIKHIYTTRGGHCIALGQTREMINTYSGWNFISPEEENLETGYTPWKGTPGRDGDGILMGMAAGGDTFRLGAVMADFSEVAGTRVEEAHPSRCLVGVVPTLWVNESAKRFTSEGLVDSFVAYGESRSTQIESYNILDFDFLKKQCEGICYDCSGDAPAGTPFPNGVELIDEYIAGDDFMIWKADTIEELAEQMGLDPVALKDTVDHYNELCEAGYDSDFLKDPKYLIPVKTAPFYGVKTIPIFMTTVGGLRVDERMRVLTPEGKAITGLYACGSDAGGLYGYEYDVLVAAGSQQSFAAVGARFAIDDFVKCVVGGDDGYVPAGPDLME